MGVKINISNTKVSDSVRVMNNSLIRTDNDVVVNIRDSEITGQAIVLEDLKIDSILKELSHKAEFMDKNSDEYLDIQKILSTDQRNKKDFISCITKHLAGFSQGVLASIVANLIT